MLFLLAAVPALFVRRERLPGASVAVQDAGVEFLEDEGADCDSETCECALCESEDTPFDEKPDCCFEGELVDYGDFVLPAGSSAIQVNALASEAEAAAGAEADGLSAPHKFRIGGADTAAPVPVSQEEAFVSRKRRRKVTEVVIHESNIADKASTVRALKRKDYGTHLVVDFDGSVSQHGDLKDAQITHGGTHNPMSVGIEVINPYYSEIVLGSFLRPPVRRGHECASAEQRLTQYRTQCKDGARWVICRKPITKPQHCLTAAVDKGYRYAIFGTGSKAGKCYGEKTTLGPDGPCPEGFEEDEFDFYDVEETVIQAKWAGRKRYVLPSPAQCESVAQLVQFLTGPDSGLDIPRAWAGLKGTKLSANRLFDGKKPKPGIHAHTYWAHGDGSFNVLYAYLRLENHLSPQAAYAEAVRIAKEPKYNTRGRKLAPIKDVYYDLSGSAMEPELTVEQAP